MADNVKALIDAANELTKFNGHNHTCAKAGGKLRSPHAACTCKWDEAVGVYRGARLFALAAIPTDVKG